MLSPNAFYCIILYRVGDTMRRRGIFIAISLLAVGFAAVSTTLIINGGARIIADQDNFDIYFSEAVLDNVSSPYLISEDKKTITYTTKDLKVAGETSVLDYVVTNNSTQYDAEVEINCTPSSTEYLTITNEMNADIVEAKTSESGTLTVRLNKNSSEEIETEFTCTIVASAVERDNVGEEIEDSTLYAYIKNNVGNYGINKLDDAAIYYYDDSTFNNVMFANFCWKIVRTTDTGGVKLVYNGVHCGLGGSYNQLNSPSAFNLNFNSVADIGYMYNTRYQMASETNAIRLTGMYGNSFTYDIENNTYELVDTKTLNNWGTEYNSLNSSHYTCFNTTGICTDEIYYVYLSHPSGAYYIKLTDGKRVETALEEMLSADDVNTKNSTIKDTIDTWYEANMTEYTTYLEDTVWCNDRSVDDLGGWNPNGGDITSYLYFHSYNNTTDLSCPNKIDSFTVEESSKGNGALDYPVGLLTYQEANLIGTSGRHTGTHYWLLSPQLFNSVNTRIYYTTSAGLLDNDYGGNVRGVRPAVSLKSGTEYISGDGSVTNPFVIN